MSLADLNRAAIAQRDAPHGGELAILCRALLASGGDWQGAANLLQTWRGTPRIKSVCKAAVAVGGLASETWGDEISNAEYTQVISAFLGSLRNVGAFDRLLPDMVNVPLRTSYAVATGSMIASTLSAGSIKPLTSTTFTADQLSEQKVVAVVVASREFMLRGGALATNILNTELSAAIAAETDDTFISLLTSGANTTNATGIDARAVRRDIGTALAAMTTSSNSRLYALMRPSFCKSLATMFTSTGDAAFPTMTPAGGSVCGITAVPCDAVGSGNIVVVDAAQVAAGSEGLSLRTIGHGDVVMNSAPDSPQTASTVMVNLWATSQVGLVAERFFSCVPMGSTAVQLIANAAYADSPAP